MDESSQQGEGGLGNLSWSGTFSRLISSYLTITSTPLIHNGNFRLFDVNLKLGGSRAVICDLGWLLFFGDWEVRCTGNVDLERGSKLFFSLSFHRLCAPKAKQCL